MEKKLQILAERFEELNSTLANPSILGHAEFLKATKKRAELEPVINAFNDFKQAERAIQETRELLESELDPEMRAMAEEELDTISIRIEKIRNQLKLLLIPKDENDTKDTIVEIRAGTGGEEAALFAANLYRMYWRYAERQGWKCESMSINETGIGGIKEVIFSIAGTGVYGRLKFESGVHRVQRVPETEASGRIHTSAATVAVLPEAEEVDVHINDNELRIDVFRSSGPGGQSVNTTDSAVRITHIPSGIVISCQDEKSQHKNKAKALRILRTRLLDAAHQAQSRSRAADRRHQIGSGDRSERVRTYNFPQQRLTDHRIGLTLYKLTEIIEGDLDEVIDALLEADNLKKLAAQETSV